MRPNKNGNRKLMVNGMIVEVVSVTGLARIVGKSRDTILRYERTGVIPVAPLLYKQCRCYPISLANKLAPLIEKIPGNKKPDANLLVQITQLFNEEMKKYAKK